MAAQTAAAERTLTYTVTKDPMRSFSFAIKRRKAYENNATRTIRSEEITIDVRICAALAANRGGEVYLAAIAPDMELTVITLDEAPGIQA